MNIENDSHILNTVKSIAVKAGSLILDIYKTDFSDSIKNKKDNSPVTIADKAANDFIVKKLNELTPDIPIITEENTQIPYEIRKNFKYFWLVDPLDGTKEFINKNGEFTVNIALINKNSPVTGIVFVPVSNTLYWATKNAGAFKQKNNTSHKIMCSKDISKDKPVILVSRSHLDNKTKEFIKRFNNPIVKAKGSALKFLLIAEGKADIYLRYSPTMEWDTAASHIILKEAGASIENINTGEELKYNKKSLINPGFIVKPIHQHELNVKPGFN